MIVDEIDKLIEQGEKVREEKKWDEALTIFDRAIVLAANEKDPERLISILGHKLIIYKHLFYETKNRLFLELFRGEVETGLNIIKLEKITGRMKGLMLIRQGDYYLLLSEYKKAVEFYTESVACMDKSRAGEYAEYLGHLGLGQALSGDPAGFETFKIAESMLTGSTDLRPFHKSVVLAGIKLRAAKSYAVANNIAAARENADEAEKLGQEIAQKYGLPLRLEEALRLKKEIEHV